MREVEIFTHGEDSQGEESVEEEFPLAVELGFENDGG